MTREIRDIRVFLLHCVVLAATASAAPSWVNGTTILDSQGNMYVVGTVTADTVPVTADAFQIKFNAGTCGAINIGPPRSPVLSPVPCRHIFAAKISPDGS